MSRKALQPILDGFRWLGMDWDEGPEVGGRSRSLLPIAKPRALPDGRAKSCSRKASPTVITPRRRKLRPEREAAEKAKRPYLYSRKWMADDRLSSGPHSRAEGRKGVVRLKMPREGVCHFTDHIRGPSR